VQQLLEIMALVDDLGLPPSNPITLVHLVLMLVVFRNLHQTGGDHTSVLVPEVLVRTTPQQLLFHML
tara:strand:- start:128 stop:328 length:201 start_codon:yes stop_codon:yes gene_type:complete